MYQSALTLFFDNRISCVVFLFLIIKDITYKLSVMQQALQIGARCYFLQILLIPIIHNNRESVVLPVDVVPLVYYFFVMISCPLSNMFFFVNPLERIGIIILQLEVKRAVFCVNANFIIEIIICKLSVLLMCY